MSEYVVIYEQAEDGGWGAYLPDMPGVVALGTSRAEVEVRIKGAIDLYIETVGKEVLPRALSESGTVIV